ncbi:MAG TPA: alpha/beta hydrolase [Kribbella sp.]|nr:alpha/beta hydrolase [Kribbella sp.]
MATARELGEVEIANTSGRPPVVFVHGLWLLAGSWLPWQEKFLAAGFAPVAPGWPDDPESVGEGRANPSVFAGKSVAAITQYYAEVIGRLERKPAIVGHSFGGLITQKLAGMGLGTVSVPIDPAPGRGVLPLPLSALRASFPALKNPANRKKAVMLTYNQFRFAFVNAVPEAEARRLYDEFPVPGAGLPVFQAASANFNPNSETLVDRANPDRGPMKFLSGEKDHTVPWALTNAAYKKQLVNPAVTEIEELPGRGHSLVIDSGWEQVADAALAFVQKYHA